MRKKRVYTILLVLGLLMLLAGIASYVYTQRIKPLVKAEIKAFIERSTQHLYRVEFSSLSFNLWTGSAYVSDIKFFPDTLVYKQQIEAETAPNNLYYIELEKLSIERFRPLSMIFKKEAKIKRIVFEQPNIQMFNKQFNFNDSLPPKPRISPYAYISKFLKSLQIQEIYFQNASVKYINNNAEIPEVDSISKLNVKLKDWLIDPQSATDSSRIYLFKDVHIGLDDYRFATADSLYYVNVKQLDFALKAGLLHIKQFSLEPRYSTFVFGALAGFSRDRYIVKLNDLQVHGINLPAYISKRHFLARYVQISDGLVQVENDNRFPNKTNDKTGRFPHQLLQALKVKIGVDSIAVNNIDVSYGEFDRDSQQSGKITFEKTKGVLRQVGNMGTNPLMEAQLESYVMGQGKLLVNFIFDRLDPKGAFTYQGILTNLDGRTLNQLIKPLGMLQVNRGEIKELTFDIKANADKATGSLNFKYNDLSVALMKKEAGNDRLVRQRFLSFLANNLVIYSDNPNHNGKFTRAQINFKRKRTASFFNFIWKSLFQGVKISVGISPAKELEIQRQIHRFEQYKEDREDRKQKREIRKAKRP